MKKFKKLYRKITGNKIQQWQIAVDGSTIRTWHGHVDGKIQESAPDLIKEGKNIGRANETTPEEQALLEAKSRFTAMKKKGYVDSIEAAENGTVDDVIEGGVIPMLAQSFKNKMKYPLYVQPKLDGIRSLSTGQGVMWSRTRKIMKSLPTCMNELKKYFKDIHTDGECYNHEYKDEFEKINSIVTNTVNVSEDEDKVQYHIYDLPIENLVFEERHQKIKKIFSTIPNNSNLVMVETIKVNNHVELMEAYDHFIEQGYEGAMARDPQSLYDNPHATYRSKNLQKVKVFEDAEFKIVDIEEGRGKLKGHVAKFICEISDDHGVRTFNPMPMGDLGKHTMMKKMFEDHTIWKGKWVTVQFQGWSQKNIKPRFPKAKRFRNMDY